MIAILDYGAGNLRSVAKALETVGASPIITDDPGVIARANGLVVPGSGLTPVDAMGNLERLGLVEPLRQYVASGRPFLGVCLGEQVIFESSEEGRGVEPAWADARDASGGCPAGQKVPHIGWNSVRIKTRSTRCSTASPTTPISTSCTRTTSIRPTRASSSARPTTASRSPRSWPRTTSSRPSSTPRKAPTSGSRSTRNFAGLVRARRRRRRCVAPSRVFEIIPAIDLRGGRCVRLVQGDFDRETVYGDDPAAHGAALGGGRRAAASTSSTWTARRRAGLRQLAIVAQIVEAVSVPVQLGGGIRDRAPTSRRRSRSASIASSSARPPSRTRRFVDDALRALRRARRSSASTRATAGRRARLGRYVWHADALDLAARCRRARRRAPSSTPTSAATAR